jgi:hypothetical protein
LGDFNREMSAPHKGYEEYENIEEHSLIFCDEDSTDEKLVDRLIDIPAPSEYQYNNKVYILLLMPLAGLHFCVELDFVIPSLLSF